MGKSGFSLRRLIGVSATKSRIARKTGIPTTKTGRKAKIGGISSKLFK